MSNNSNKSTSVKRPLQKDSESELPDTKKKIEDTSDIKNEETWKEVLERLECKLDMLTVKQAETNTKLKSIECTSQKSVKLIEGLEKRIKNLESENQQLHVKNQDLEEKMLDLEYRSRHNNLLLDGIAKKRDENDTDCKKCHISGN